MNKMTRRLSALYLLTTVVAANADSARSTVPLQGITNIHLLSGYELVVTQGDEEYVTIIADSDYIDAVEARVKGDTLALGTNNKFLWGWFVSDDDREITFEVQVRELKHLSTRGAGRVKLAPLRSAGKLALNIVGSGEIRLATLQVGELQTNLTGSGTLRADAIETEQLRVAVQGSGDVELGELSANSVRPESGPRLTIEAFGSGDIMIASGEASEIEVSVSGSGDVDLKNLRARRVKVKVNGSGDVKVHASEQLDVTINGSGDVEYRGAPTRLTRSVDGSGDIRSSNQIQSAEPASL